MKNGEFISIRVNRNMLVNLAKYATTNIFILESELEFRKGKLDKVIKIELKVVKMILLKLTLHDLGEDKEVINLEFDYEEMKVFRNMLYLNNKAGLYKERMNRIDRANLLKIEERLEKIYRCELM